MPVKALLFSQFIFNANKTYAILPGSAEAFEGTDVCACKGRTTDLVVANRPG